MTKEKKLLFRQQPDTCCQAAQELDSGVSRLFLRSKILNEPANRYWNEVRVNSNEKTILQELSEGTYGSTGRLSELWLPFFLVSGIMLCLRELLGSAFCLPISVAAAFLTILLLQLTAGSQRLHQHIKRGMRLVCLAVSAAGFLLLIQGFLETVNRLRELCNLRFYTDFLTLGNGKHVGEGSVLFWTVLTVLGAVWVQQQIEKRCMAGVMLPMLAAYAFALVFEQPELWASTLVFSMVIIGTLFYYEAPGRRIHRRGVFFILFLAAVTGGILLMSAHYGSSTGLENWKRGAAEWLEQVRYGEDTLPEGNLREASGLLGDHEERLKLTMSKPQVLYLRGFVGSDYKNGRWGSLKPSAYLETYEGLLKWLDHKAFSPVNQYGSYQKLTDAELNRSAESIQVTVENSGASRKYIYLPATACDWSAAFSRKKKDWQVQSTGILGTREYTFSNEEGAQTADSIYPAYWLSSPSNEAEQQYLDAEAVYHSFAEDSYMELTPEQKNLMEELFPDGFDDLDFDEATAKIRLVLRTAVKYTEQPEEVPTGQDPLTYFLTESKTGNAVCFASAAVMAYRTAGYPARYVEGYHLSATEADRMQTEGTATAVLTSQNAHAWAEVYVDGIGWLPVEVVPGFYVETYTSQTIAGKPSFRMNPSMQKEGESPDPVSTPAGSSETTKNESINFLKICLRISAGAILLCYLCVLFWIVLEIQRWIRICLRRRKEMAADTEERLFLYTAMFEQTRKAAGVELDLSDSADLWIEIHRVLPELDEAEYLRAMELLRKGWFGKKSLYPHEWHTLQYFLRKMQTILYRKEKLPKRIFLRNIYLFEPVEKFY